MDKEMLKQSYVKGARSIVKDYLRLTEREYFLIICDETTREIADYVKPEAVAMGAKVEMVQFNTDKQVNIVDRDTFPFELAEKINNAQCILNVVAAKPECTDFRIQIIKIGQKFGTRIAHVTGLRIEDLRIAFQVDFDADEILKWNDILFRLLYFAKKCTVITKDKDEISHELHLNLGGTARLPAQSGIVRDGSWCNIPGSEVYIAPIEDFANGDIVINGSMLGNALKNDVLIKFKSGKIESWQSMDPQFQKILDNFSKEWKDDSNWNSLCELGFGLNIGFKKITGNQLLDEKMGKTCHIAIGSSKIFGGQIESKIHQDFVTWAPTIIIDGKKIMEKGIFTIDEADVYEELDKINVSEENFIYKRFRLTVREMEEEDGKMGLDLKDGRNQPFFFQVGDDATSRKILKVMEILDATPEFSYEEIKSKFDQAPAILTLLLKYEFIKPIQKNDK